ncbi:MAG: hypothetical protein R3231_06750 [bacterium]|nr:hypothetical protein [bacterium]
MANAGRDPIFWATLAVAEHDFEGADGTLLPGTSQLPLEPLKLNEETGRLTT